MKKNRLNIKDLKSKAKSVIKTNLWTLLFVGWLWEVLLYLFRDGVLVNRGTTYGPWLPIYGISCTAIILLVTRFKIFRKTIWKINIKI